jgi:hypothetical protein
MLKLVMIGAFAAALTAAATPNVVLSGSAKDCLGRQYVQVPGVTIGAFNPTKNRKMVDLLKAMDTAVFVDGDTAYMTRFETKYAQLVGLVTSSTALARATSDSIGTFALSVAALDSALVIGYRDSEDMPNYYSYRMVGARANSTFYLDMSRGDCHYP